MSNINLSILIPAYNEQDVIEKTVIDLVYYFDMQEITYEVLVINNNSNDDTLQLLRKLSNMIPAVNFVNTPPEPGYGVAVRTGLDNFKGENLVITMADGSETAEDVYKLYKQIIIGNDCGFGTRFSGGNRTEGYPIFKLILNRLGNKCISWLTGFDYDDYTNGFKAYSRKTIEDIQPLQGKEFELTIEMSVKAVKTGAKIGVVPNSWVDREAGESKFDVMGQCFRYLVVLVDIFVGHHNTRQIRNYIAVGLTASVIYLLCLSLFIELFQVSVTVAVVLAYFVGLMVSYIGTSKYVFSAEMKKSNFVKFLIVVLISLLLNIAISETLTTLGVHYLLIGLLIVILVPIFNYACHSFWTFKSE